MLCMNACSYATIPFRVTHSKKDATDLLNKQCNWNVENVENSFLSFTFKRVAKIFLDIYIWVILDYDIREN